jgi:hypothetical protein
MQPGLQKPQKPMPAARSRSAPQRRRCESFCQVMLSSQVKRRRSRPWVAFCVFPAMKLLEPASWISGNPSPMQSGQSDCLGNRFRSLRSQLEGSEVPFGPNPELPSCEYRRNSSYSRCSRICHRWRGWPPTRAAHTKARPFTAPALVMPVERSKFAEESWNSAMVMTSLLSPTLGTFPARVLRAPRSELRELPKITPRLAPPVKGVVAHNLLIIMGMSDNYT